MRTSRHSEKRNISTSLNLNMFQCAGIFSRGSKYSANSFEGGQVRVFKAIIPGHRSLAYVVSVPRTELASGGDFSRRFRI